MSKRFLKSVLPALVLPLALAFPALSQADFISCTGTDPDYDISNYVTPSTDCAILAPVDGNDNDSLALINGEAFFSESDWLFDGKALDDGDDPLPSIVSFTGNSQSGTWSLIDNDFWSNWESLMFVFKDGGSTNLTSYLIQTGATGGTYQSPFIVPPFVSPGQSNNTGPFDISHISVFYRGEGFTPPFQVPEPGLFVLFGTGLMLMGWAMRRRRSLDDLG